MLPGAEGKGTLRIPGEKPHEEETMQTMGEVIAHIGTTWKMVPTISVLKSECITLNKDIS